MNKTKFYQSKLINSTIMFLIIMGILICFVCYRETLLNN